ncbi:MAG: glutamate synthase large subunit, partial [Clostridiales bacterium]|nr:glutamate synthase large subunit [Candidatus Blautia equi]
DRILYVVRREFEQSNDNTYVVSMSSRTIVYKGMFLVGQLRTFFEDLQSQDYESALALVHSRFSTNTNPSWERAHPNRFIVHNGEINTIRGNADKMLAREENMASENFKGQLHKVLPVINRSGSDSAMLDNALEFLVMNGMDLPLAVMITIPEPWANNDTISQEKRDFYQYYATMMEPWDGPASIVFSDGDMIGAVLDRNGLRPSRYYVTSDGYVILSSEVGVLPIPEDKIVLKERLHPGKMLLVDTVQGKIIDDNELKESYAKKQPYGEWLDYNLVHLKDIKIPNQRVEEYTYEQRAKLQKAFGYTYEQYRTSILSMAQNGIESIGAMGIDTPLAVLSKERRPLFDYFKQLFAQVTNPPIDAIREEIVTSTSVYVGKDGNLLEQSPLNCHLLKINNPILTNTDMLKIKSLNKEGMKAAVVSILYYKSTKLERAMDRLFVEVDKAFNDGANILVLSDRGVDENHMPIPSLLAVSAVHRHLVNTKKSTSFSIILESGEPREVHHFATLLGYGASAINPYLAQETIRELIDNHMLDKDYYAAVDDYNHAVISGITKIASKMGISTIQSYQGSQIFEAIGISESVIDKYFTGTVSRIGGITMEDIEDNVEKLHSEAFDPLDLPTDLTLDSIGAHKMRSQGEQHRYNPQTIYMLQQATWTGDYNKFKQYTELVNKEEFGTIRTLIDFKYPEAGIPIDEVESVDEIVKRFKTGAMSYGSISQEAHETLAIAMNHLHGKSNTGEGGESDERLDSANTKDSRCSAIKQVASGRFGVTSRYLVSANEIQIKMAQGAKPGEGGHLPAKKVYPWIAKTRHSTPGVSLISPPPHHDIYSIEDLAQLIYDLKNANKYADISVKLVSEAGVGTVAAGVAKAGAQVILISGYDGGTGAAPRSSIHNAGLPWELGLAETHQTLLMNGLRNRVRIETDGKLMSGRDVAIAALLGAEEFGFATGPLVTMGCVMMRVCNLDTCPVGVATQNPELRKRFRGKPEYVENYMRFMAQELREYMAKLGFRSISEMVGRSDLLVPKTGTHEPHVGKVDLEAILNGPYTGKEGQVIFDPKAQFNFELEKTLDEKILIKKCKDSIETGKAMSIDIEVGNTDRTFGTLLGAEITRAHKDGMADDTITVNCKGAGGQSFGAFIPKGLTLKLTGDSNDYFGKGLSGGKLILKQPENAAYAAEENIIVGNVALYGATSGTAYINGVAGERFAVRNSGAHAVVEGVGEHGCEYMTGGRVVVLGRTGKNFAAGMSGGIAYVLDLENQLYKNLNKAMISIETIDNKYDKKELRDMIQAHVDATGSKLGQKILDDFDAYLPHFKKLIPDEYKKMITISSKLEDMGLTTEQAQMEAFYESVGANNSDE